MTADLAGTLQIVRFILRRDRIRIPIWIIGLAIIPAATVSAYHGLYPTAAERAGLDVQYGASKAIAIITGPAHGLGTAGGFAEWRLGASLAAILALMAIFSVVRHTRAEEEAGRADLMGATAIGRLAPLAAAVLVTGATCVLAGAAMTAGLVAAGAGGAGAVAFGAATALCGLVFTAVAAIAAQLGAYSRTANGLASGILGGAYLLRGVGDSSDELSWLSWVSPVGWAQKVRPYTDERWWVLGLSLALTAVLLGLAVLLARSRDVGGGWLSRSTGPASAAPALSSAWGLAARTHRGILIGWAAAVIVASLLFGALTKAVAQIVHTSPQMEIIVERMGGAQVLSQTFINIVAGMIAMILSFYVTQAVLRIRAEEVNGHAELVLSTGVSRWSWAGSHTAFAAVGSLLLMLLVGLATGVASLLTNGGLPFGRIVGTALAQTPAVWIVAGLALLVVGWLPRHSGFAWAITGVIIVIGFFGPILDLPSWVLDLSPFQNAPTVDGGAFDWATLVIQIAIAVVLIGAGMLGVRRRDIPS